MKKQINYFKFISITLVQIMFVQQCAFAAPALLFTSKSKLIDLEIPAAIASVDEVHAAPNNEKTIYLIQDPHANASGQMNVSRVLTQLFEQDKSLHYVFLEAGYGDESLSYVRELTPLAKRKTIAEQWMKKGKVQGPEHFDLVSDVEALLWGVEDLDLYKQAWQSYKHVHDQRKASIDYLNKVNTTIDVLRPKVYNRNLLEFDAHMREHNAGNISLSKHVQKIAALVQNLQNYPQIKQFIQISRLEKRIDFDKANQQLTQMCAEYTSLCQKQNLLQQISQAHLADQIGFFFRFAIGFRRGRS